MRLIKPFPTLKVPCRRIRGGSRGGETDEIDPTLCHGRKNLPRNLNQVHSRIRDSRPEAYRKWAENGAAIFRNYGCIEIAESWEDNVPSGKYADLRRAVDAKDGEKIVFTGKCGRDPRDRGSKNARGQP